MLVRSVCTLATYGLAAAASASIIGGSVTIIEPPPAVGNNNFQATEFFAFDELQNVPLTAPLATDQGQIIAETIVSSHYIAFDPGPTVRRQATAEFDGEVLGVLSITGVLSDSDFLGAPGTEYQSPSLRGLESEDSYSIDGRTVSMNFRAGSPGDYIRVITRGACGVADVTIPVGVLDIDDVLAFLDAFSQSQPVADVAEPIGVYDIDDVLSFLDSFVAGCPG